MIDTQEKVLLRFPEVAARFSIGRTLLYDIVRRGELPVVKVGKEMRIPAAALNEWVEKNQFVKHQEPR